MERGKKICRILKDIRKQIAAENEIEFVTSECRHKGDCAGTCPKCEAEVQYLESQLARRRSAGRTVRLTGISMGIAAVAPALVACDTTLTGDPVGPIDGEIGGPMIGEPAVGENVNLGENLVFDLIPYEAFMAEFTKGGWQETEIYDVYPGGGLGEEILANIAGYVPRKYAFKEEGSVRQYIAYNAEPERFEYRDLPFVYYGESNWLCFGVYGKETIFTVASINEKEMVCYGEVFSSLWAPDAYIGKYVFRRVSDETVAEWDGKYVAEKAGD